jgi:hypothetical protein
MTLVQFVGEMLDLLEHMCYFGLILLIAKPRQAIWVLHAELRVSISDLSRSWILLPRTEGEKR